MGFIAVLFHHHLEHALALLMATKICTIACASVLPVVPLEVALVSLDIVEHILVTMQKLRGVGTEEFGELVELRLVLEEWVFVEKLSCIIVRLELGEALQVANAELCHLGNIALRRFLIQGFVELRHLAPGIDTVVVQHRGSLNVLIEEVSPIYIRIFLLFLDYFFFDSVEVSEVSDASDNSSTSEL